MERIAEMGSGPTAPPDDGSQAPCPAGYAIPLRREVRLLQLGKPITHAVVHNRGKVAARVDLSRAGGAHPYMLALSQATSERLLEEALTERGLAVEWGVSLGKCAAGDRVSAELYHPTEWHEDIFHKDA